MKREVTLTILACGLLAISARGAAAQEKGDATGLPGVVFGMSAEAVKKAHPSLELVSPEPEPEEGKPHIRMAVHRLAEQKIGKLTCNVDLKFLVGKLSFLDFYCRDKQDVPAHLEETYGKPLFQTDNGWQWDRDGVIVSYAPASGIFYVAQKRANEALQGSMLLYLLGQGGQTQGEGSDGQ